MRSQYSVGVDGTGLRQRRILFRAGVDEGAVAGATAARRRRGARNADQVRLYFADGMPARDVLRIIWQMSSICLLRSGSFAEQNRRVLAARNFARAERQRHHVERDAERLDALAQARQAFDRPRRVQRPRRQQAADVIDAETGEHAQDGVGVAVLRAGFHQRFRPCADSRGRRR